MSSPSFGFPGGGSFQEYTTKKEKVVGVLATLGIGAALFFGLGPHVFPSMLATIQNFNAMALYGLQGILYSVVAVLTVLALFQERTWTLAWHGYNMFSRAVSKAMIKMDPTGRLEAFASEYLAGRRAKVINAITKVTAIKKRQEQQIADYQKKIADAHQRAEALLKRYYNKEADEWTDEDAHAQYRLIASPLKMWEQTLEGLLRYNTRLELQLKQLSKFKRGFDYHIENTRNFVEELKTRYEASKGMSEAAGAISGSVGDSDMKRFFDDNVKFVEESIARFDANVDIFLEEMPQYNKGLDFADDVAEDELTRRLLEWDASTDQSLVEARVARNLPPTPIEQGLHRVDGAGARAQNTPSILKKRPK